MSSSNRPTVKKPQRRFQFIDNSNVTANNANSTQVRRHVMQEYMREKRWESRSRAEDEVLDAPAHPPVHSHLLSHPQSHPHPHPQHPPQPSSRRKVAPRTRTKYRTTSGDQESKPRKLQTQHAREATLQPSGYDLQPPCITVPSSQLKYELVEDVPRTFAPATQLEPKRPQPGFYLTPQSFAMIADVGGMPPLTPPSTIESGRSLSPASSLVNSFGRRDSFSSEPSTILSAARTDPFNCLPMVLSTQDQELFDFYATVMPACSYGFERRSPRAHNWYLSVFIPEAMKSPVAFQNTILVHAANTQAWVRNLPETRLAIEHRARALEMLSEHFQKYPFDTSDAAISSTLSAAALEDFDPRLERRQYAWLHWHAAVQKIRDRGGPAALEQNKSLRMLINWSDYIFSGYDSYKSSFYFDHRAPTFRSGSHEAEVAAQAEVQQQCEEFIIFLRCAESMALVASNMQSSPTTRKTQSMRHSVFAPGQPLHNLLASPNGSRYTETGQLKQIVSRLAALMTINVAIWEHRYSPRASEEFFHELVENIKYNDLDRHISVEALIQILLSGSQNPSLLHTERPWLVGRLLKVAKRLSRDSWERLNDFLLQCLTLSPPLAPFVEGWEHDLRDEICAAPLTSVVLPLMKQT